MRGGREADRRETLRVRSGREADCRETPRVRNRRRNLDPYRRNPSAEVSSARTKLRFSTIGSEVVSRSRRSSRRGRESEGRDFSVNLALGPFPHGFRRKRSRFRPPGSHSALHLQGPSHSAALPTEVFALGGPSDRGLRTRRFLRQGASRSARLPTGVAWSLALGGCTGEKQEEAHRTRRLNRRDRRETLRVRSEWEVDHRETLRVRSGWEMDRRETHRVRSGLLTPISPGRPSQLSPQKQGAVTKASDEEGREPHGSRPSSCRWPEARHKSPMRSRRRVRDSRRPPRSSRSAS